MPTGLWQRIVEEPSAPAKIVEFFATHRRSAVLANMANCHWSAAGPARCPAAVAELATYDADDDLIRGRPWPRAGRQ